MRNTHCARFKYGLHTHTWIVNTPSETLCVIHLSWCFVDKKHGFYIDIIAILSIHLQFPPLNWRSTSNRSPIECAFCATKILGHLSKYVDKNNKYLGTLQNIIHLTAERKTFIEMNTLYSSNTMGWIWYLISLHLLHCFTERVRVFIRLMAINMIIKTDQAAWYW